MTKVHYAETQWMRVLRSPNGHRRSSSGSASIVRNKFGSNCKSSNSFSFLNHPNQYCFSFATNPSYRQPWPPHWPLQIHHSKRKISSHASKSNDDTTATTTIVSTISPPTGINSNLDDDNQHDTNTDANDCNVLVYESPLGPAVHKLRAVSLLTGVIGTIGLPLLLMLKTGGVGSFDPSLMMVGDIGSTTSDVVAAGATTAVSSTESTTATTAVVSSSSNYAGILSICLAFGSCTIGTTFVVHYVFAPYVYTMEQIPIRLCSNKSNNKNSTVDDNTPKKKETLYQISLRNFFLMKKHVLYDPRCHTIVPYTHGYRPLCNLYLVEKKIPLYIHVEMLSSQHNELYNKLHPILQPNTAVLLQTDPSNSSDPTKIKNNTKNQTSKLDNNNPDDFF
jgi:hypothetical protein